MRATREFQRGPHWDSIGSPISYPGRSYAFLTGFPLEPHWGPHLVPIEMPIWESQMAFQWEFLLGPHWNPNEVAIGFPLGSQAGFTLGPYSNPVGLPLEFPFESHVYPLGPPTGAP